METKKSKYVVDVLILLLAGSVVAVAFFFFQNSNGVAPGGVGGIATGVISGVRFSLMLKSLAVKMTVFATFLLNAMKLFRQKQKQSRNTYI